MCVCVYVCVCVCFTTVIIVIRQYVRLVRFYVCLCVFLSVFVCVCFCVASVDTTCRLCHKVFSSAFSQTSLNFVLNYHKSAIRSLV